VRLVAVGASNPVVFYLGDKPVRLIRAVPTLLRTKEKLYRPTGDRFGTPKPGADRDAKATLIN
jgi:hypothetical protein